MDNYKTLDVDVEACPVHPNALVKRITDFTQYIMNGYPAGSPIATARMYECSVCGHPLKEIK